MPLPVLFVGAAAVAAGGGGIGTAVKAGLDMQSAQKINDDANEMIEKAKNRLELEKEACSRALCLLGEEKLFVLDHSIREFLEAFKTIKEVEFQNLVHSEKLKEIHVDRKDFDKMDAMVHFACSFAGGLASGTTLGALMAFGAYGATQTLACASTGTAISTLSGVAASNATLAFLGGGTLATGGLGIAGGTMILGGLVAGPALLAMGLVAGHTAQKELDKAKTNQAEAVRLVSELEAARIQCIAIRRRAYTFYNLLARLDAYFLPLIYQMEDILKKEGSDFKTYTEESKKAISSCASVAASIQSVLQAPILTEDGQITKQSSEEVTSIKDFLNHEIGKIL